MNQTIIDAILKLAVGRHWKTSTTGIALAIGVLATYFGFVVDDKNPFNWHYFIQWVAGAAIPAVLGRILRDPSKDDTAPPSSGAIAVLLIGGIGLLSAIFLTGCTTNSLAQAQPYVDGVVDRVAGARGVNVIQQFRDAEGRVYVQKNGYISTNGLTRTARAWAADEHRWITGKVQRITVFTQTEDVLTGDPLPSPEIR